LAAALASSAVAVVVAVLLGVVVHRRHADEASPVDQAVVDRLLADPVLAPLAAPTMERLARAVEHVTVPADEVVVREGESGDRYYLVFDGVASVTVDGRDLRQLNAEDSFGEVALLRDVPRTATVRAVSQLTLLGVPRDDFLEAVTGSPRSLRNATSIVDDHLSR
jgi:CRP-like cAMP-binding protein